MNTLQRYRNWLIKAGSLGAITLTCLAGSPVHAFNPGQLDPAFAFSGGPLGIRYNDSPESSFGFFFELADIKPLNALGFSSEADWETSNRSYTVTLWSYLTDASNVTTFTEEASVVFDPTQAASYLLDNDFYWQPVPFKYLPETASDAARGYIIGTIGNFTSSGNLIVVTNDPTLPNFDNTKPGSSTIFQPDVVNNDPVSGGNGYNAPSFGDYPVPVFFDATTGFNGYFNANFSTYVPGPLPVMGAAAALGWSRKLRQRVKGTRATAE